MKLYGKFRSTAAFCVRVERRDAEGRSIFGAIDLKVARYQPAA